MHNCRRIVDEVLIRSILRIIDRVSGRRGTDSRHRCRRSLSWKASWEATAELAQRLKDEPEFDPKCVIAVHVVSSAGGVAVGEWLACRLCVPLALVVFDDDGTGRRQFAGVLGEVAPHSAVVLVDDIAFSGKTLRSAMRRLKEMFLGLTVRHAALVTHQVALNENHREHELKPHYHVFETDRDGFKMPWGQVASPQSAR